MTFVRSTAARADAIRVYTIDRRAPTRSAVGNCKLKIGLGICHKDWRINLLVAHVLMHQS